MEANREGGLVRRRMCAFAISARALAIARDCFAKKGSKGQMLDAATAVKKPGNANQTSKAEKGA